MQAEARGDVPVEHARQVTPSVARIESGIDSPHLRKIALSTAANATSAPTERSIWPMIRIIVMPTAMIPWFETCRNTLTNLRNRQELRREIDDEQHKDDRERVLEEKLLNADLIRRSAGAIRGRHACIAFHDDSFLIFSD